MEGIFEGGTIPVPGSSPEGHDDPAAVETNEEEQYEEQLDQEDHDGEEAEEQDSDANEEDEQSEHSEQLLAGKYKSTDELVKGYKELQREYTKLRQGGGGQQQQPAVQQMNPQSGQQQDPNQAFWNAFRDNPLSTIHSLVQHVASQQVSPLLEARQTETLGRQFEAMAREYKELGTDEGMQKLATAIRDVAAELGNPDLANNPTPRVLRMAAQEAFGDSKAKAYELGKQAGRQESEQTRQAKQGLGAKGGARRGAEPEMSFEERTKAGILAAGRGGGLFG